MLLLKVSIQLFVACLVVVVILPFTYIDYTRDSKVIIVAAATITTTTGCIITFTSYQP